ncbi:MAG: elongation factor G [Paludibacter sp.]|nr:elongation factor G [Bacteroidales bacterium]MCM1068322.1 elongation factor G [Prevotella sp.]MCM1354051.1 elongation factor G [Bacteroides sp.]MCM1442107.1 elongation factor G [Muribaculum sp.]MCM1481999.1 elongation factor G [Paludibacter sp.]
MKTYQANEIKNISLMGSSGSGKTTLIEAMLYESGVIKRRGSIDAQNTVSDYFPVEKEYGYSVFSTVCNIEFASKKLNIIDCPGSDDFIGGTVTSLNVTDTAVVVLAANEGVEVGTQNHFRYTEKYKKPVAFLINKLDHENANYEQTVEQLRESFGNKVVIIQYPMTVGTGFNAVIDVLAMKMYQWKPEGGEPELLPIPASEEAKVEELRAALFEMAAEADETLMEKFFESDSLSEEETVIGLRKVFAERSMFPVLCASAQKDMGVRKFMEFVGTIAPSVSDAPQPITLDGKSIACDPKAPTSLFIFKTSVEPHIGEVNYFKVMSGTLHGSDDLINIDRGSKERISQLYTIAGSMRTPIDELQAGDIAATVKLKDSRTGNTLNAKDCDNHFGSIKYPEPKYRRAIRPATESDAEKLSALLTRMHEEDPTWIIEQSKELRQTIVHGQGEFHLRTLKWRLENNDKMPIVYEEPKIPYRETITKSARADYRHKKQSGGSGQFGEVHLIVEPYEEGIPVKEVYKFGGQEYRISVRDTQEIPLEWGGKLVLINSIVGGAIDARFIPAILKGIMDRIEQGPLTGSYARDVRVIVYDGKMHPVDSNEISFRLAGRNAFAEAFRNAGPKILEPVYDVDIFVPSDKMGDVMSDLQGRRGMIMGMHSEKGFEHLTAQVPLKELSSYSTTLSSLTGGRASFAMKFNSYQLVPTDVQDKLLKEYSESQKDEE